MNTNTNPDPVWIVCHGGANYSPDYTARAEEFPSRTAAEIYVYKFCHNLLPTVRTPCAEDVEFGLYTYDPRGERDPQPDDLLSVVGRVVQGTAPRKRNWNCPNCGD